LQFLTLFAQLYRDSSGVECARLAAWLLDHLAAANFTESQIRNAFNLTVGQWTTLKAKLTSLRTAYNAVQTARGE
jgi:hypothetical protein